jgi:hypothetical protein
VRVGKLYLIIFFFSMAFLQSCYNTYYITADNLHQELNKVKDTADAYKHKYWDVIVLTKYFNNGLKHVTAYDKAGNSKVIDVYSNTVAIITTKEDDKKRVLFRTMFAKDSLLYGQLSFPSEQEKLNFNNIKAIRIKNPKTAPTE